MKKNTRSKKVTLAATLFTTTILMISNATIAHSGHGDTSTLSHNLEHTLWYSSVFVVFTAGIMAYNAYRK